MATLPPNSVNYVITKDLLLLLLRVIITKYLVASHQDLGVRQVAGLVMTMLSSSH